MKRDRIFGGRWRTAHGLAWVSACILACAAGCTSKDEKASAEEAAVTAADLDDAVASRLLAGGCELTTGGASVRTTGSGGACPTTLSKMVELLEKQQEAACKDPEPPFVIGQPLDGFELPPNCAHVFVVSEKADLPDDPDTAYRFVIANKKDGVPLFLSTVGSKNLGEDGVEAMGFSPSRQAYVFYKVERGKWVRKGDGTQVKSTVGASDKPFECVACHKTGGPLMKEIHDSWGNWHSNWFTMPKPKGANALFSTVFDKKKNADRLEELFIPAEVLHSQGRVERALKEGDLKGIMTQLMCEVGEPSIVGAHGKNATRIGAVKTESNMLPLAILLNQHINPPETGGTGIELGLDMSLLFDLPATKDLVFKIHAPTYVKAVKENGQTIGGGKPGDTIFPMSSPEKSFADIDAIQELVRRELIDVDVMGDALMTDFTVSSFSKIRCELASTLPKTWKTPAELKKLWAANLTSATQRGAKGLRRRLLNETDNEAHGKTVADYTVACSARPDAAFTTDILKIVSQRRVEFTERYKDVIESQWLIPQDTLSSKSGALRLNGKTCTLEPSTKPFLGED